MKKDKKKTIKISLKQNRSDWRTIEEARILVDKNGNSVEYPEIVETNVYELIKLMPQNRPVNPAHRAKMGRSVAKLGAVLRCVVLVEIDCKYYIADGQHLKAYLEYVGLPVRCMVYHANDFLHALQVVTTMNSTAHNWSLGQFIQSWCFFNPQYRDLIRYKKEYGLTYTVIAALLSDTSEQQAKKDIKEGEFAITNGDRMMKVMQAVDAFHNATGVERYTFTTSGLIHFISSIGVERYLNTQNSFIAAVKRHHALNPITPFARKDDAIKMWNKLYHA
jgi:hypothetical protein